MMSHRACTAKSYAGPACLSQQTTGYTSIRRLTSWGGLGLKKDHRLWIELEAMSATYPSCADIWDSTLKTGLDQGLTLHYKKGAHRCTTPVGPFEKVPNPTNLNQPHTDVPHSCEVTSVRAPRWSALRWSLHPGGHDSSGQPDHTGGGGLIGGKKTEIKPPHRCGADWWADWWSFFPSQMRHIKVLRLILNHFRDIRLFGIC